MKQVLESCAEYDSLPYSEWQGLVEDEGAGRTVAIAGQRIKLGEGAMMEVLSPGYAGRDGQAVPVDDASVVLRIVCGSVSILLTGDISTDTERDLLDSGFDLAGTVLKVAHHGSDSSSCPEFLAEVDPQVAVISVGAGNRFGHPSREVVERLAGARVYRTDQQGTVELTTDGNRLWVKTER